MTLKRKMILLDDGFRVGVTYGGRGTPLVFLHGLTVSAGAYGELLELLANHGFSVTALDLVGHGRTDSLEWGHSVSDMAAIVNDALAVLGIGNAVIVGHSMGGAVAVEYAASRPWLVDHLILLDPATGEDHHKGLKASKGASFLAGAMLDIAGEARKAGSLRRLRERLSLAGRLGSSLSGLGVLRVAHALMKHDSKLALRVIADARVPTMVIHGDQDLIIRPLAGAQTALDAGGKLQLLKGRFHAWMISDPVLAFHRIAWALDVPYEESA